MIAHPLCLRRAVAAGPDGSRDVRRAESVTAAAAAAVPCRPRPR